MTIINNNNNNDSYSIQQQRLLSIITDDKATTTTTTTTTTRCSRFVLPTKRYNRNNNYYCSLRLFQITIVTICCCCCCCCWQLLYYNDDDSSSFSFCCHCFVLPIMIQYSQKKNNNNQLFFGIRRRAIRDSPGPSSSSSSQRVITRLYDFLDAKNSTLEDWTGHNDDNNNNNNNMKELRIRSSTAKTAPGEETTSNGRSINLNINNNVNNRSHIFWRGIDRNIYHKINNNQSSISTSSLGDIMDGTSGLTTTTLTTQDETETEKEETTSTSSATTLARKYGITNPLDRMALTANGNLQRLISSYYDAPVSVIVEYCQLRTTTSTTNTTTTIMTENELHLQQQELLSSSSSSSSSSIPSLKVWDRVVHLLVYDTVICTATSVITVHDPYCQQLVESGTVGLGQLFRYLDILPNFYLHNAGKRKRIQKQSKNCDTNNATDTDFVNNNNNNFIIDTDENNEEGLGGGFWRDYTLRCVELTCRIHEEFTPGLWNLRPPPSAPSIT